MIQLPPEFLDFLKCLNRNNVRYLLIGGYAVAHYGYVRATGDMDVFVELSSDNADLLQRSAQEFGLGEGVTKGVFLEKGAILRFGLPPMRLEILNEISGVTFQECWPAHNEAIVDGVNVPLISLECLLKNKKASGRTKDQLDVEQLGEG